MPRTHASTSSKPAIFEPLFPQKFDTKFIDRLVSDDPTRNTKTRLLDAAEQLYTNSGQENLSLRDLTDLANVNLAAVNYHFGSKNALICEMVARRLDPVNEQRVDALAELESTYGYRFRAEHLFGMLAKNVLTDAFDITASEQQSKFAVRVSSDLTQPLREFLTQRYRRVEEHYLKAFCLSTPWLPADEVAWRVNMVAFAMPGIALNTNTLMLIRKAVCDRGISKAQAIAEVASALSASLAMPSPDRKQTAAMDAIFRDVGRLSA